MGLKPIDKNSVIVSCDTGEHTITRDDIKDYIENQPFPDINSGLRQLGTIIGDWRVIDDIAQDCMKYFNNNLDALT